MGSKYPIHGRIYEFVVEVLKVIKLIPKSPENLVIINQLTRSVTSMGANDREADGVISRNDFIHKYSLVRKEGKETEYWLQLLSDTNPKLKQNLQALILKNSEIVKIISSIIYNTQKTNVNKRVEE